MCLLAVEHDHLLERRSASVHAADFSRECLAVAGDLVAALADYLTVSHGCRFQSMCADPFRDHDDAGGLRRNRVLFAVGMKGCRT